MNQKRFCDGFAFELYRNNRLFNPTCKVFAVKIIDKRAIVKESSLRDEIKVLAKVRKLQYCLILTCNCIPKHNTVNA